MNFLKSGLLGAVLVAMFAGSAVAQTYSVGTNPQGSLAYAAGSAVSKVGVEQGGLQMRVVPQGGPNVVVPLVNAGELEFSITSGAVGAAAFKGQGSFKRANENIRLAAVLFPLPSGFMVRADSDIRSISDLAGKRIATGYLKQKILDTMAEAVLGLYGLGYQDVTQRPVPNGVRGVADFEAGNVDAAFFSLTAGRTRQAAAAIDGGIRFLPISVDLSDKMATAVPGTSITPLKPGPALPGIEKEQGAASTPLAVLTSTNVPDDVVYNFVKALCGNREELISSLGAFRAFDPTTMNADIGVPIHQGAEKFYAELGM